MKKNMDRNTKLKKAALATVFGLLATAGHAQERARIIAQPKGVFDAQFACYKEVSKLIGNFWDKSVREVGAVVVPKPSGGGFYLMTPNAAHYYAFDSRIATAGSNAGETAYHYKIALDGKPVTYLTYRRVAGDTSRPTLETSEKPQHGVAADKIQVLKEADAMDDVARSAFGTALSQRLGELEKSENQSSKKAVDAALDVCAKVDDRKVKDAVVKTKMTLEGVARRSGQVTGAPSEAPAAADGSANTAE